METKRDNIDVYNKYFYLVVYFWRECQDLTKKEHVWNPVFENKYSASILFDVKIWQPEMIPT